VHNYRTALLKAVEYSEQGHRLISGRMIGNQFEGPVFIFDSLGVDSVQVLAAHGKLRQLE
jgi:hypothetical protein